MVRLSRWLGKTRFSWRATNTPLASARRTITRLAIVVLAMSGTTISASYADKDDDQPISPIHEAVFGVPNLQDAIDYWNLFGYDVIDRGSLSKQESNELYAVNSAVKSVRLQHMRHNQGFIRLWQWDRSTGPGPGLTRLLTPGTRWMTVHTTSLMDIMNEVEEAEVRGEAVRLVGPGLQQNNTSENRRPMFFEEFQGIREIAVFTPVYRRVFWQIFNGTRPNIGHVSPHTRLKTSQMVIGGMAIASDDPNITKFYDEVLGLPRSSNEFSYTAEEASGLAAVIYELEPKERVYSNTFRNPVDKGRKDISMRHGGSLFVRRVSTNWSTPAMYEKSRPGRIGLTLFTYAVKDLDAYHARVSESKATNVTDIMTNEFGEQSFSFRAPDGMDWNLVKQ